MSSPPPPPPPGPPPPGPPPPGPPPSGTPPPPPPSSSSVTSANYFFGFVITFVVLLLLFIGCGLGSWRRFRLMGTAWDVRLQDIEGNPFQTRKRTRRRLVRPTFLERWTSPTLPLVPSESKWENVQVSPPPPLSPLVARGVLWMITNVRFARFRFRSCACVAGVLFA